MPASRTLLAIGAGLTAAILFAAWKGGALWAFALTPLAPLPLFAAGLSLGVGAAAIAAAAATMAVMAAVSLAWAISFVLIAAAPAVFLVRQALLNRRDAQQRTEWYPPGLLVMWLAGIAAAGFVALMVASLDVEGGLESHLRSAMIESLNKLAPPDAPADASETVAGFLARFVPGVMASAWMQMIALSAILAQALVTFAKKNLRPTPRMVDIGLPSWLPVGAAIATIGAFMPGVAGFVGANLLLVALTAFVFAGLAVIHAFVGSWSNRRAWLVLVYIVTFGFTGPAILVALLGVADTLIGLRHRVTARAPGS